MCVETCKQLRLDAGKQSHDFAPPASALRCCHSSRQKDRLREEISPSPYILWPSFLLTITLLKVSTKAHCHSPYPSLSPHAIPSHPPSLSPFPLSLIVVFAQEGRKSAYPTHRDVCQSHTKFKLLGKAQLYLCHQQQTCVCVYSVRACIFSPVAVCVCTVNKNCTCLCVNMALLLWLQGQVSSASRANTFMWEQDYVLLTPLTEDQIC